MVQQIVLPIKDSNVLKMVQDTLLDSFRAGRRNYTIFQVGKATVKYMNNLIEQDHRPIKRRNKFYRSLRTASSTIKGMETIRGIYKKNRRNGTLFGFSVSTEIKILMGIPA